MKRSIFLLIGLLCAVSVCFGQNQQVLTKEQEEIRKFIMVKTDTLKLDRMKEELTTTTQREKNAAIRWAKESGNPIRQVYKDGRVIELQRLDKDGRPVYNTTYNLIAAQTISTDEVQTGGSTGLNLDGAGIYFGIWDGGKVYTSHTAFREGSYGAIHAFFVDSTGTVDNHATHVAGTILADNDNYNAQGMANKASIDSYDWNYDIPEMVAAAREGRISVSNHSYGPLVGWHYADEKWYWYGEDPWSEDFNFSKYSEKALRYDSVAYIAPYFNIIVAAGNNRGEGPAQGQQHYVWKNGSWVSSTTAREIDGGDDGFDCLSPDAVAKNVITVGAVDDIIYGYTSSADVRQGYASFSGWGPVKDGRIKPDIVANGWDVYSTAYINPADTTQKGSYYDYMSGTSQATPSVSGSIGLLLQYYKQTHNNAVPISSMVKALIIHTADEAGDNPGPDYKYGWGLMNTKKATDIIKLDQTKPSVMQEIQLSKASGSKYTTTIFCDGTEPLKLTLAWTDPHCATTGQAKDLMHDLDITLTKKKDGTKYYPWVLDPVHPANAATTSDNVKDNVEQIFLATPDLAEYIVEVSHKSTLQANQVFSLIITGNTDPESKIFIKQLDNAGNVFEKASYWGDARWIEVNPTDKITFKVEKNYFKAKQDFKNSTTEKYTFWRDDLGNSRYKNWDTLTTIVDMTELIAQFTPAKNAIIQNNLEGTNITNSYIDAIFFKDPWLADNANATYGAQSRGLSASLKTYESPLNLSTSSSFKGVLQNQGTANWNPPYYSVKANSQLTLTINNRSTPFYFLNWSGPGVTIKESNALETPVQFTAENAVVKANYKGSLLSNSPGYNNRTQRQLVDSYGYIHLVYQSMDNIWYERSGDNGATWQIMNGGKPLNDGRGKDPSIDYYPQYEQLIIVYQDENPATGFTRIRAACFMSGELKFYSDVFPTINSGYDNLTFDQINFKPVVGYSTNDQILVAWQCDGILYREGLLSYFTYQSIVWNTLSGVDGTNWTAEDPAIVAAKSGTTTFHLAWEIPWTSIRYAKFTKATAAGSPVIVSSIETPSTGCGFPQVFDPAISLSQDSQVLLVWKATPYSASSTRPVIYRSKTTSWGSFTQLGSYAVSANVGCPYGSANYGVAWKEGSISSTLNKIWIYGGIKTLSINGLYTKMLEGSTDTRSKVMTFEGSAAPFSINMSQAFNTIHKEAITTLSYGKQIVLSRDSFEVYVKLTDVAAGSEKVKFIANDSTNSNDIIESEEFPISGGATLSFNYMYGVNDSMIAQKFFSKDNKAEFFLELIKMDQGNSGKELRKFSFNSEQPLNGGQQTLDISFNESNGGKYKIRLTPKANFTSKYYFSDIYNDESILMKKDVESVNFGLDPYPTVYALSQNYPNPFNPSTIINYDLPEDSRVTLKVYDILGREVMTLVNEFKEAGRYNVIFNASQLATGIYIYELRANDYVSVKKMSFVK